MIYLDYSANTPADPAVLETYVRTEQAFFGNPNARHPAGAAAREKLGEVTGGIARLLSAGPDEVILTSGASEANNLAVKGIARAQRNVGKHILSTALEHPSVSGPLTWLQEQGYEIDLLDIGRDGKIDLEQLEALIRDDTVLVAVTAVDSELGVVQPVEEICRIVRRFPGCRLHVDAVQAVGKIPFSFDGPDTVSLAAHKFYGLNGSGMLYKKRGTVIEPLIHGGSGASLYRSGTPALAQAAALEAALSSALLCRPERYEAVMALNRMLRDALSGYPAVRVNSPDDAVPHILNISVSGVKGADMQRALAGKGVCVSVKSACSVEGTPSRAVFAVTRDRKNALSSFRISLSHLTTPGEIREFLEILDLCIKERTP
ncbi:MAG: cysteine desulfurase [Lachnospiraceae bacterium]|nr:cysteine desulfurase [Lachnospiraceae bacterium]